MVGVKFCKSIAMTLILFSSAARAEVLFEGYAKVLNADKHIGYFISRYEFDAKAKKFISIYLMKLDLGGTEMTESVKAYATDKMAPLSYQYTSISGKETKTIDAKFVGTKMTAQVKTNGKPSTLRTTIPAGAFLSTFLIYTVLNSPQGIKVGNNFRYDAIAEETGELVPAIPPGEKVPQNLLDIEKETTYLGLKAYQIKNKFKKRYFTSFVSERGETLGTTSADMPISTELVADPAKATAGFAVSKPTLIALFGEVPEGKTNVLAKSVGLKSPPPATKQEGIPQGQGIQIKTDSSKSEPQQNPGSSSKPAAAGK